MHVQRAHVRHAASGDALHHEPHARPLARNGQSGPVDARKARVEAALQAVEWNVDVVLSHTTPLKYEPREVFLPGVNQALVDKSTEEWLDTIEGRLTYKRWFCGHYHTDKRVDRLQILFEEYAEWPVSSEKR